jgi:3',5'-nucleoside bisphosphate phosphatase
MSPKWGRSWSRSNSAVRRLGGDAARVRKVRIDLHTHSHLSDGTTSPADVVREAAAAGLTTVALTDHDTTAGWGEARVAAAEWGIELVPGIEISTRHAGQGAHLLAYGVDPAEVELVGALDKILAGRNSRVPAILERLRAAGIEIDVHDVRRAAGPTAATGRPHIADALVSLGVVRDREEAFALFLGPGRPGYVERAPVGLVDMIEIVTRAGGVAVLAHPWGRHPSEALRRGGLAELRDAGLAGLEVDHEDHPAAVRAELREIASDLGLIVTGASDHHGAGKVGHDLGCNLTAPEHFRWLLDRANAAWESSGRAARESEMSL